MGYRPPIPMAFSVDQAVRLSGVSKGQITRWDRTGLYRPSGTGGFYSFRDLVALRTLHELRNERGIPLKQLRDFGDWLRRHQDEPWATMRFFTSGNEVLVYDKHGNLISGKKPGQLVEREVIPIREVLGAVEKEARQLNSRRPDEIGKIAQDRGILGNAPRIAGTRIPTSSVWEMHSSGTSPRAIASRFPQLTIEDVEAAIEHEKKRRAA